MRDKRGMYLRLTGEPNLKAVTIKDKIGEHLYEINNGEEIIVITNGSITSEVQKALESLSHEEIKKVGVYGVTKIHPLDLSEIYIKMKRSRKIVLVDEGNEKGFASLFLLKYKDLANKVEILAHPNSYLKPGNYLYMLQQAHLDSKSIHKAMTT